MDWNWEYWFENLAPYCLPLAVILIGIFNYYLANKKRNDELFDRRYALFKRIFSLVLWHEKKKEGIPDRDNPYPFYNIERGSIDGVALNNLTPESECLFDPHIGIAVEELVDEILMVLKGEKSREVGFFAKKLNRIPFYKFLHLNKTSQYFPTFTNFKNRLLAILMKKVWLSNNK
jgi:hypothetical protein